jgi:hypothetical protein
MGADLYTNKIFKANQSKWEGKFNKAVAKRNGLPENSPEREEAQKAVTEAYERMHEVGYFRDSYNDTDLIWKYDLSWWGGLDGFMNKDGNITVTSAKKLLKYLDEHRDVFLKNIEKYPRYSEEGKLDQMYFKAKLTEFRFFLLEAITNKEHIECSV